MNRPSTDQRRGFVAGTRGSRLALWQTAHVLDQLRRELPSYEWESRILSTHGDRTTDRPLAEIGGRGAFTDAIERELEEGGIDFAVHSLKDLPVSLRRGFVVAAVVGPRNPGETMVSREGLRLEELAPGAIVGTSSLRRRAQLLRKRPDLEIRDIRGNVETRIAKVERGEYDATLLAAAGVERLELIDRVTEELDEGVMLPAPGQGAIAVECRGDDARLIELLARVDDAALRGCVGAERSFLAALGGGCTAPVAALAVRTDGGYELTGRVVSPEGGESVEVSGSGNEPNELGVRLAEEALSCGASELLRASLPSWQPVASLAGRRVVVTRPPRADDPLVSLLSAHGAELLSIPTIRTRSIWVAGSLDRLVGGPADWVVLTSRTAVEELAAVSRARGRAPASIGTRFAAVGPSTAEALRGIGIEPEFIARGQSGEALAGELPEVEGREILFPCAEVFTQGIVEGLRRRGAVVTPLPLYRTESMPVDEEGVAELRRGVDWILFTSGSTVRGLIDALGEERNLIARASVACIGPSTAAVARELGLTVRAVAAEHTAIGLVAAIVANEMEGTQ